MSTSGKAGSSARQRDGDDIRLSNTARELKHGNPGVITQGHRSSDAAQHTKSMAQASYTHHDVKPVAKLGTRKERRLREIELAAQQHAEAHHEPMLYEKELEAQQSMTSTARADFGQGQDLRSTFKNTFSKTRENANDGSPGTRALNENPATIWAQKGLQSPKKVFELP